MAAVAAIVVPAHVSTPTALPHVEKYFPFRCVSCYRMFLKKNDFTLRRLDVTNVLHAHPVTLVGNCQSI